MLVVALTGSKPTQDALAAAVKVANNFRVIFFILTFFSIGLLSDFKRLWSAGIGKLAAVYVVSLFGFVIWVGLLISWLFFAGVKPPLAIASCHHGWACPSHPRGPDWASCPPPP